MPLLQEATTSLCTPPTDNANPLWVTPLLPTLQTFDQVRTDVHYKVRLSYTLLGNKEEYHSFRHKCRSKKKINLNLLPFLFHLLKRCFQHCWFLRDLSHTCINLIFSLKFSGKSSKNQTWGSEVQVIIGNQFFFFFSTPL